MPKKIRALNRALLSGQIDLPVFTRKVDELLRPLDWQRQIKYRNLALV